VSLYGGIMDESGTIIKMPDLDKMRSDLFAVSVTDAETRKTIKDVYRKYKILLEPHGAVAWKGIKEYSELNFLHGKPLYISLETAHPAKFESEIEAILGFSTPLPKSLIGLDKKQENYFSIENRYELVKDFIIMHYK
jgi:threonine synthase